MKYYYIAKCKQCGETYQIDTIKDNFATFQLAEERNATVKALSFIHNCEGHIYGVAEITGVSFEVEKEINLQITKNLSPDTKGGIDENPNVQG